MLRRLTLLAAVTACIAVGVLSAQETIVYPAGFAAPLASVPQMIAVPASGCTSCSPANCAPANCTPCPTQCEPCPSACVVRRSAPAVQCNSCERMGVRLGLFSCKSNSNSCDACSKPCETAKPCPAPACSAPACERPRLGFVCGSSCIACETQKPVCKTCEAAKPCTICETAKPACNTCKPARSCNGCTLGEPIACDSCPRPSIRLGFAHCSACSAPAFQSCSKPAPCPRTSECVPCSKPAPACHTCAPAKAAPTASCGCAATVAPKTATCGCKSAATSCSDECSGERHRPLLSLLRRLIGKRDNACGDPCSNPCSTQAPPLGVNNQGETIVPVPAPTQPTPVPPMPPASNRPVANPLGLPPVALPSAPMPFQAQPVGLPNQ
jgi:hypothetical protein